MLGLYHCGILLHLGSVRRAERGGCVQGAGQGGHGQAAGHGGDLLRRSALHADRGCEESRYRETTGPIIKASTKIIQND